MKKEIFLLSILTSIGLVLYFLLPFKEEVINQVENKMNDEQENIKTVEEENILEKKIDTTELTFDIVRITPYGDVVMAGKTKPNIEIFIYDGEEKLAKVFSDLNGEWIWVSDIPLKPGIKKLNLKHVDSLDNVHYSDQNIIIFFEKNVNEEPLVVKYSSSNQNIPKIIGKDALIDGLSLDLVDYSPQGEIVISGRSNPDSVVTFFQSTNLLGKTNANKSGLWKFVLPSKLEKTDLKVSSMVKGENLVLDVSISIDKFKNLDFDLVNRTFVVKPGNSLWRIARRTLGGGIYYTEIFKRNSKKISNPDLIFPGQVFNIPNFKDQ